jgi:predicted acetyltransferase
VSDDAGMTDDRTTEIRSLRPDEYRAAGNVFRASLHSSPVTDQEWAAGADSAEAARVFGAFRDDTLIGTALSFAGEMSVPGGALLPMAMVTAVGVRADQTRRGVLTGLMRAQLTGITEPIATLRASEPVIYGRFGYGMATRGRTVVIDRLRSAVRPSVPATGSVRLLTMADAHRDGLLGALYDSIGARRPGWAARPDSWWSSWRMWSLDTWDTTMVAVHSGPDGDDGFAVYHVTRDPGTHQRRMNVFDLFAADDEAWASLWRFVLSVDVIGEVQAQLRPLDEQVERLFTDLRAIRTTEIEDETWLRLVDVPVALAARTFGELSPGVGSVVVEVRDPFLPANSGRYLIGDGPARATADPAELTMDVDVLAELYLGDVAPSALVGVGRIDVAKPDALRVADRLFAVAETPWCGTFF